MPGRHAQKTKEPIGPCPACKNNDCASCVDALLARAGKQTLLCQCRAGSHNDAYRAAVETFLRGPAK